MMEVLQLNNFEIDARLKQKENCEEQSYTILHCTYYSSSMYVNGGWVTIWKNTFLENVITGERLPLVMAIGIPLAPDKHYFKYKGEYFPFTLVFDKLPPSWPLFDLKEYP